ncbi:YfhD family protein [Rummeliibacillus pycnus]|uniref:YfhD family protein n=1 Tax=Rummeliibacillus pycnus TaxID=101070 RepID=UPI003D2DE93A
MGRDNKQGKSKNKSSLPQTPKNEKIAPQQAKEETAQELLELENLVAKNKKKNKQR